MTEEGQNSEEELQPPAIGGTFLTMAFMLWIIINPELRDFMGETAGTVLEPRITFDQQYPVLTFLFAGIIMISFTTISVASLCSSSIIPSFFPFCLLFSLLTIFLF